MVVLYKMNSLTYLYAKLKVEVKSISLVNLSVKKPFVPEHIRKIDHQLVAAQLNSLLIDPIAQKRQGDGLTEMNSRYFGNEKHAIMLWLISPTQSFSEEPVNERSFSNFTASVVANFNSSILSF